MNNPVKVAICITSHRSWFPQFGLCLAWMIQHTEQTQMNRRPLVMDISLRTHSVLPKARTDLVGIAMDRHADWILFLDDDMTFPPDLIHRMLKRDKHVLGINHMIKEFTQKPTACIEIDGKPGPALNSAVMHGLSEVAYLATGVLLLKASIFANLQKPWFAFADRDQPGDFGISEDYFLCRRLREAGHTLWIDHDLSKEIGHIGPAIFTPTCITTVQQWDTGHGVSVAGKY